ncbi:hypothetical protein [Vitreimonas flagellata]|uniref:hypothetical protein n=1 Tax=Vitreimonas flagellata TaxID=2560861 RepID=UPI001074B328|nr:hypothetical protein [Vitreimonas flagellata]
MAHFEWGDAGADVMAMSGSRITELREFCEMLMYLSELLRKYWKLAPDAIEKDEVARVSCLRFRKFGMRLQLDYADGKYVLNHTRGNHRRPPRRRAPQEHKIHKPQVKAVAKRAARPAAAKRPPRKTKKEQKRVVQIWHGVRGHFMAAAIFAVVLWSSLRTSVRVMMRIGGRAHYQMIASIKARTGEIGAFVQHTRAHVFDRNSNLRIEAELHEQSSAAGDLRLEARRVDALNLTLFSFASKTQESLWDGFPFGRLPEQSELVLT